MRDHWKQVAGKTVPVVLAVLMIKLFTWNSLWVEQFYSTGCYPVIAQLQRLLTGWLPLSLGDLLYTALVIYLLVTLVQGVCYLFRNGFGGIHWLAGGAWILRRVLWLYIVFMLCWGINYSRKGIAWQLHFDAPPYTTAELTDLSATLLDKVNSARRNLGDSVHYPSFRQLAGQAVQAYRLAAVQYPFLEYRFPSVKASLFGTALTYAGYTGYYNPFSGEAQVNTNVPPFYLPYVLCHEMAHQAGYGDESEANFVGYLAATASDQPVFRYSAYYDLFNYANGELFQRDSVAARANYRALDTLVKQDLRTARLFFMRYRNRMEPVLKFIYGQYLKANNQPYGIDTYDQVNAWLIAFKRSKGKI